jgi:transglutaminase-like putative cysteine protease
MLLAAQRKHKAATHARFQVSAVAQQRPSLFWNVTQPMFDSWLPKFRDTVPNWSSRFKRPKKIRKFYNVRSTKVEKQTSLECRGWNFMIIQGTIFGIF